MEEFITLIIYSAVLQGLFLSGLFFFSKAHRSQSNKILSLFILALIFEAVPLFLPFKEIGSYYIHAYFRLPEVKLFFPFLILHYVLRKIGAEKKYLKIFRIGYIVGIIIFLLAPLNLCLHIFSNTTFSTYFTASEIEVFYMTQQTAAFLLSVIALGLSIYETNKYQKYIKQEFSDISLLMIDWLWHFIFMLLPICLLWGGELLRIAFGGTGMGDIVLVTWLLVYVAIYYVSYKAFVHGDIFTNEDRRDQNEIIESIPIKVAESTQEMNSLLNELEASMIQNQFFLNSSLTLHELAKQVNIPAKKISHTINNQLQTNFSVWVNQFRVEYAKQLLKDYSTGNMSIEGIGNQAGFKSRSAMYMAFKKITGKSPGDFKG